MKNVNFKRLFGFILAFALVISIAPAAVLAEEEPADVFVVQVDIYSPWAELDIFMAYTAYKLGDESTYSNYTGGLTAGKFETMLESFDYTYEYKNFDEPVTRGEVMAAFYEIIKQAEPSVKKTFSLNLIYRLVGDSFKVREAVDYFAKEGLALENDSDANEVCTVEEMIVLAVRTYEHLSYLANEDSKGLFWKVSGGESDVYLLGSIHLSDGSLYPMSRAIEKAFAASENIVFEVDMQEFTEEDFAYLNEIGMIHDGTTIADYISEEVYALYVEICEALEIPDIYYDYWQPWEAWRQLQAVSMLLSGETDAMLGIDMYYLAKGIAAGKNIMELESFKLQFDMLASFSPALQEALLAGTLMGFTQEEQEGVTELQAEALYEQFLVLLNAVKDGDEAVLREMLGVDIEFTHPLDIEYFSKLLRGRDKGMAAKIDELLKDGDNGDYFIIVGAAHYMGKGSIIDLLEEMGYTVERIK